MSTTETKVSKEAAEQFTPLPWRVSTMPRSGETYIQHLEAHRLYDNDFDARWHTVGLIFTGEAEAERIVRAVNSHADMLEALEQTMEMLRAIRDRLPNEWNTIVEKWRGKDSPSLAVDVWDANKAAIAKAKGGA